MSSRASYWAARWSMEVLLGRRASGPVDLFNPEPVPVKQCYLWTFTTADVCEAKTILERWRGVVRNWKGLKCFRVLEQHPGGHGWHLHFVTPERIDVRHVRKLTTRHGFGRINVKRIPADKAFYVVKYLVKALRKTTGRRLWACVGFKGVRANDMIIEDSYWREVYSTPVPSGYSLGARCQHGLQRIRAKLFARSSNESSVMDGREESSVDINASPVLYTRHASHREEPSRESCRRIYPGPRSQINTDEAAATDSPPAVTYSSGLEGSQNST